ncbi:MAG: T9SS type A sorting domain-containing protein, partial [Flavobacteriales bacterium]
CIIDDFNGDGLKDAIIQGFVDDTNVYWNETVLVSVNDIEQDQQVTIFPNPSNGIINVKLGDFNTCVDLKIHDALGKVVYSENNFCDSSRRLSLNLPAGAYVLTLNSASTFISKELIIQR